ncbi:METTL21A [Symbiodinium natans]|uniref:METTL21A protein n=1 Tax=Symbiodinium natans TaxID=878477 RepID=A0A812Q8S0_9DINO|nr:METTL21A [Symbiodinium natans]
MCRQMLASIGGGSFDLVVGSDIVFATRLVQPLILTILALLQGSSNAACWLCVQRRDPDAHALLLVEAAKHFNVNELSFAGCDGLEAACELECILLCFTLSNDRERLVDNMPTQSERERRGADEPIQNDGTGSVASVASVKRGSPVSKQPLRKTSDARKRRRHSTQKRSNNLYSGQRRVGQWTFYSLW